MSSPSNWVKFANHLHTLPSEANKMVDQPTVKKKIPPKPQSKQEKKKKGPSKPQPAWLFPADEENPVLNPREKSHAEVERAIKDREKAVDYMQRRVHGVPDRPAPDPLLLTLIGIFLTDFGFNSTSRLFTNERQARQTLNGWEEALGKKIDKKTPKLEQIFRDWHREWAIKQDEETSSSESSSEASSGEESETEAQKKLEEPRNSNDSDSTSAVSDVEMKDAPLPKKAKKKSTSKKIPVPSSSSSSSTSDSDADDEKENAAPMIEIVPKRDSKSAAARPTVGEMVNKLKRKARSTPSSSASADIEDEPPVKVKKVKTGSVVSKPTTSAKRPKAEKGKTKSTFPPSTKPLKALKAAKAKADDKVALDPSSSGSSAEFSEPDSGEQPASRWLPDIALSPIVATRSSPNDNTSDSDSDGPDDKKLPRGATLPKIPTILSDSSATINGDSKKPSANVSPSSDSSSATSSSSEDFDAAPAKKPMAVTAPTKLTEVRKHKGAKPTPLAELSKSADAEAHPSNKYQSYTYADKAYKDLSVTRGKGFTKEKNKKKRGSYRGGPIDTSGGKSYKFED